MKRGVGVVASALSRLGVPRAAQYARRTNFWPGGELTVVLYHRVVSPADIEDLDPDLIDATPEDFDQQMGYLHKHFHPVGVEEVLEAHRGGKPLAPGSVLVTFDDGYLDNYKNAFPILQRYGMRGLFFVSTGHVSDRRLFWWEHLNLLVQQSEQPSARLAYPEAEELDLSSPSAKSRAVRRLNRIVKDHYALDLDRFLAGVTAACAVTTTQDQWNARADRALMTWDQVREMRKAGMGIGSHTHSHRVLNTLAPADLESELRRSRAVLEQQLGEPVTTIAYPVGKSIASLAHARQAIADAGYELGFTTTPGTNRMGMGFDPYDLRRLPIDRGVPTWLARMYLTWPTLAR